MKATDRLDVFRQIGDHADDLFFFYNVKNKSVEYASPAFHAITKREVDSFWANPSSLYSIIHPEDTEYIQLTLKQFLKHKKSLLLDFRIIWPDSTERWVRMKIYPMMNGGETELVAGILEDDSARKANTFTLQKVNTWKNSVLEILAHDLKGPIGIVQMLSSAIKNSLPQNENVAVHEWTSVIYQICQRNIDLIHSLLKKETIDSEGVALNPERADIIGEINEILKIYRTAEKQTEREIQFTHSHDSILLRVDSMKFLQVINNLLSNALKFTQENGLIKIHVEKLESSVLITVSDNGIGIPKEDHPYLFNKYTKAQRTGLKGEEPTGLGMWIIKSFTDSHKGRVWFESEVNEGTTFYIEIPSDAKNMLNG